MRIREMAFVLTAFYCVFECSASIVARPETVRAEYSFDSGWLMRTGEITDAERKDFDDRLWQKVTLPRAFNENDAFRVDIHSLPTGVVWYRKHFVLPKRLAGGRALLEFEGVRQASEVFINGVFAGRSENGVMAFGIDATALARPAPEVNVIAVRVDNDWKYKEKVTGITFQWNDKNFYANYGGINKSMRLHMTGPLYQTLPLYSSLGTTGIYIWADQFDIRGGTAGVHAESQVRNESSAERTFEYRVSVRDNDGHLAGEMSGGACTLKPGETRTVEVTASDAAWEVYRLSDIIYDPVGGDVFMQSLRCMAPEGRIMPVGFAGGACRSASSSWAGSTSVPGGGRRRGWAWPRRSVS